jgi:predicted XRE-type DNA-binding protein
LQIELRAINDKRNLERKELAIAQEKIAEAIGHNRQLCSTIEQMKIDFANCLNHKQGLEKVNEQLEMHKKVMSQELDFAEQQKLTQFRILKKLESNNSKMKEAIYDVIQTLKVENELDSSQLRNLESLLNEKNPSDMENGKLYELPPCNIQTYIYKPF